MNKIVLVVFVMVGAFIASASASPPRRAKLHPTDCHESSDCLLAVLDDACTYDLVRRVCPLSCGLCEGVMACEDADEECPSYISDPASCNEEDKRFCRKTCGVCE